MDINEWLSTDIGIDIWNKKYRHENESLDEWFERVSGGDKDLKDLIKDKKFLFGGRSLTNRGVENSGSMFNCYSSGYVEDDYSDIMDVNKKIGLTYKAQGGQGLSLSKIRPKGTPIGEYYQSDGIVPWMELYNTTTTVTSQGGCIFKDELVLTKNGYKKISEIKIGDYVHTKNGYIEVDFVFDKGVQELYEVTTQKGYKIRTTPDHKFSIDGFNTKPLSALKVGDNINIITKNTKSEEFVPLAYFLGYFNGNGYVAENYNGGSLTMHCNQNDICDRLLKIINEDLGFEAHVQEKTSGSYIRIYLGYEFIKYLKSMNLIKNKTEYIEVPDIIMNGSDAEVASYVSGAIDSDGTVYKNAFKYDTVSKKYAEQLMLLFNRIGFFPSMSCSIRDNKLNLYSISDSFRANQPNLHSIKKDNNNCGLSKNSRLSTPYTLNTVDLNKDKAPHLKKLGRHYNIGLFTYINASLDENKYEPIVFDKIISINRVDDGHVYDISLKEEHLFSCNGFYISNSRKGAILISLDAFHKEIDTFITIKSSQGRIEKANLSVEINDEFMSAVEEYYDTGEEVIITQKRIYSGHEVVYDVIPIRIYKLMCQTSYDWAEPGVIFTDKFRNYNLMQYDDDYQIITGNPCGEQPMPKDFSCNLGSINLAQYIINSYYANAKIDYDNLEKSIYIAVRALDQLIDENADKHPVEAHKVNSLNYRNIGLGYMGVATALFKLMVKYGTEKSFGIIGDLFYFTFRTAVFASNKLAQEKGVFPKYKEVIFDNDIIKAHFTDEEIRRLKIHGIRNCSLLSIAPNGSISTMLNVTGGCEPEFSLQYTRKTESLNDGEDKYYTIYSDPIIEYQKIHNTDEIPEFFVTAKDIKWENRISMQAVMQQHVDTAISSTVNLPKETSVEDVEELYLMAYHMGLKGVTIYVDGCKRDGILSNNTNTKDEYYSDKVPSELPRGMIYEPSNDLIGKKRKLVSGCGNLWVNAWFDPISGDMMELFLSKGSTGVCNSFMTGLSRMTSLALRAGAPVEAVLDQLNSTPTCPSYAVRTATKKDTSKGTNCTNAIGNMIVEMQKEVWAEILDDAEERDEETKPIIIKKQQNVEKKEESHKESQDKCPVCGKKMFFTMGCKSCECGFTYCG